MLTYCGVDSMLEFRTAMDQMKEMGIIDPEKYARTGRAPSVKEYEEPKPPRPRKVKR